MFLRFIGGEFEGGEFPLKLNREITIGRGSAARHGPGRGHGLSSPRQNIDLRR